MAYTGRFSVGSVVLHKESNAEALVIGTRGQEGVRLDYLIDFEGRRPDCDMMDCREEALEVVKVDDSAYEDEMGRKASEFRDPREEA